MDLVFCSVGRPARWEFSVSETTVTVYFKPVPFWLAYKYFSTCLQRDQSSLQLSSVISVINELYEHCVTSVEIDHAPVRPDELPIPLYYSIGISILIFNGLLGDGSVRLRSSLNFLKRYARTLFEEREWTGKPPPLWVAFVLRSYLSLNKGLPFSKERFTDEPYVLVEGWFTVAEAEGEYYKSLSEQSRQPPPPMGGEPQIYRSLSQVVSKLHSLDLPIPPD